MLGFKSSINSLVAQQKLAHSDSALSQAITRLSSATRINSAVADAAALASSSIMQTQINSLNQGVSNAKDWASTVQSGLSSLTNSLRRIRQLATQASNGSMSDSDRAELQQEVTQQIQEVNRMASQTTHNGMNILNASLDSGSFLVGPNVEQSMRLNLSQDVSAASPGNGVAAAGNTLGTISSVSIDSAAGNTYNASSSTGYQITSINVQSDGKGGFTYTDQINQALSNTELSALFGEQTDTGCVTF